MYRYSLIVKTGESEIKAIENSNKAVLEKILPLIEVTRGRKTKEGYPFENRLSRLKKSFSGQRVAIDLTSNSDLSSPVIDKLYDPKNGYENWFNFLIDIKKENIFLELIPTILLNVDDPEYNANLLLQVQKLKQEFSSMLYRNNITDEGCYDDFDLLKEEFKDINLLVMVDCEYTAQATQHAYAQKVISRVKNIKSILGEVEGLTYIVSATSFPNNVSEIGDAETDTFDLSAIKIHKAVSEIFPDVIYGDYGSINPIRNDRVLMSRGWIPRIDVALPDKIYYYKRRRPKGVSAYSSTYTEVARLVQKDGRFPSYLGENWGVRQINNCATGGVPGSKPSFWIAVRMNIHLEQQVSRLLSDIDR